LKSWKFTKLLNPPCAFNLTMKSTRPRFYSQVTWRDRNLFQISSTSRMEEELKMMGIRKVVSQMRQMMTQVMMESMMRVKMKKLKLYYMIDNKHYNH
jgi:hypothetical protein